MKKYLLTALLGVFGLFTAFASADDLIGNYSFTDSNGLSTSISIPSSVSQVYAVLDVDSGNGYNCSLSVNSSDYNYYKYFTSSYSNGGTDYILDGSYSNDCSGDSDCVEVPLTVNSYQLDISDSVYSNFSFGCDHGYLAGTVSLYSVSSSSSDSSSSPILSGGTTAFSGIITSLGSTISEFIPYVAYVGLGLLGAIIGFVAIKWLMNWIRAKVLGSFNSRRRK